MSELEDLIHDFHTGLFEVGLKGRTWPDDSEKLKHELKSTVLDKKTLDLIEVPELFDAVDYTSSKIGKRVLFRSLMQPPINVELIRAKQESTLELERDQELRNQLSFYIISLAEKEDSLINLFYGERPWTGADYDNYRGTKVFFERMVDGIKGVEVKTLYLQALINDIEKLGTTRTYGFVRGPVFSTWGGLKPGKEVGLFTPRIKFTLRGVKPSLVGIALSSTLLSTIGAVASLGSPESFIFVGPFYLSMFSWLVAGLYPRSFDQTHFIEPLRDMYKADTNVWRGMEAVGKIDELLSFVKYSQILNGHYTMPSVTDGNPHYFIAEEVLNPILTSAKINNGSDTPTQFCIPNDVELNGQGLTMITGPNDGGKTTYSKTIAQTQLLAQIGCFIPARKAEMSVADQIHYSAAIVGKLKQKAGDYKLEMLRLRNILFNTTPRSVVILNDAITGTTSHQEGIEEYYNALDGFYAIHNNTILVTHNLELVRKLASEGKGRCLQVGFREGNPTYRIIPGISEYSHASAVSKKIGMAREDIQAHLSKKGYLN